MKVADAHCDTLVAFNDNPFHTEEAKWNLEKFRQVNGILQYMAIFTNEEYSGPSALAFAVNHVGRFIGNKNEGINILEKKEDYVENKVNILLSLEGGSPIINDINNLYAFYKLGIRAMTLTWNHRNFIGDGVANNYGLTEFGKDVVREMENIGMIVDVSHLSFKGFDDVAETTKKPFIASHSNAFDICGHPRNLKDYQIKEIINRKGFIGLNFYSEFIANPDDKRDLKELFIKHVEFILDMGGENTLGLGADFDGMDRTPFDDVTEYAEVYRLLTKTMELDESLADKIMYKNLVDYTLKML